MKKITTVAGTYFLIWLLFSPVVGIYLFLKTYPNGENVVGPYMLIYVLLTYLVLGVLGYYLIKSTSGVFIKEYKPSEWGVTVSYVVLTSMLYNVVVSAIIGLIHKLSLPDFSILISPFIFWFALVFVAKDIKPVPQGVVKKSIYFFIIVNLVVALIFKFLLNQMYLSVADLILVVNSIIFYFATKKYLTTVESVKQSFNMGK